MRQPNAIKAVSTKESPKGIVDSLHGEAANKPHQPKQIEPSESREKRKLAIDFVADLPTAFVPFRKASIHDCRKSNLAGLNQLQRRREPFGSHTCSFPEGIVDFN